MHWCKEAVSSIQADASTAPASATGATPKAVPGNIKNLNEISSHHI